MDDISSFFSADPFLFKLVSEAKRIKNGYLVDPLLAVHTSKIDPFPHQIIAVYDIMLQRQPLIFLLADDPGAGKTITAGLFVKEGVIRGDIEKCLIIVPGKTIAEQWQDELHEKFQLEFEIITKNSISFSRTGNSFAESNLIIARLDELSRDKTFADKLIANDWDMIVVDEAHKMAAHVFGGKVTKTKRYKMGESLRDHTRHLLFLTATPHNGKKEDFQLFLALLDKDRFGYRSGDGIQSTDISDIMRRMAKEDILTFEEKKLFRERISYTKEFYLSREEKSLYDNVTNYVKEEFKRAEKKDKKKKNVVGFVLMILQRRLASSPDAIYQSLKKRRERLEKELKEYSIPKREKDSLYDYSSEDLEDYDDYPSNESEKLDETFIEYVTTSDTMFDYEREIEIVRKLELQALELINSEKDSKWEALRELIQNDKMFDANGFRRKLIIFTEHRPTLDYLVRRIRKLIGRDDAVVFIHGDTKNRKIVQEKFMQDKDVLILVATDAAGESVNLHRANHVISYDPPWNTNRLTQRFGRIHRIGQKEICYLWNFVTGDTIEGHVFKTLFNKLDEQKKALGNNVFDVLGKVFRVGEMSLKDILIDAIRYSEDPQRKVDSEQRIEGILDLDHIKELEHNAVGHTIFSKTDVRMIREEFERINARRLQPHFVSAFFIEALNHLGGTIIEREKDIYEIKYVPSIIRQKNNLNHKYERVCFDKELINMEGKPTAEFLCPGNYLFDSTLNIILDKYLPLLNQGTILIDESGKLQEPAIIYYLEYQIDDERKNRNELNNVVSRQLNFVYLLRSGKVIPAGYAPYLDCKSTDGHNIDKALLKEEWLINGDKIVIDHFLTNIIPFEHKKLETKRNEYVNKIVGAVKETLGKGITYWDNRAIEFEDKGEKEHANKARQRADELYERRKSRLQDLAQQKRLIARKPIIIGKALAVPKGMVNIDEFSDADMKSKRIIELLAIDSVMKEERKLGREPRDVSSYNYGWDIESIDQEKRKTYFIEVKGREKDAQTVTVTFNEIKTGKNIIEEDPDKYMLAIVIVDGERALDPVYIKNPYDGIEINYITTSVNFNIRKLLTKSESIT